MTKKLKIVSISAELSPFSKTGGLADVARSLPKALKRLGHDVIMITPLYGQVIDKKKHNLKLVYSDIKVYLNSTETVRVNYWRGHIMEDLPVYFVENKRYFSQSKNLYGSPKENARFLIFDVAALKLISLLKYEADIVHCHDWHTGLIPFYLKTDFRYSKTLRKAKTVFTIHNLAFQFGHNWWEVPANKKDFGRKRIPHIADPDIENINFAKRAILSADIINTVSEQYREEIMTIKFGQDLQRILRNREDRLYGIINGIDFMSYNPDNDPGIQKNYNNKTIKHKKTNKEYLQKILKLPIDAKTPMISLTSRVTFQKGFELLVKLFDHLLSMDIQIVIMGDGDKKYLSVLKKYCKRYPKKLVWVPFSGKQKLETMIYAASDIFLLPSHHEPCGINQMIAMRYGCVPVVRRVGGLHDTVVNYNAETNRGTGFSFPKYDAYSLYGAIIRSLENYHHKEIWNGIITRGMLCSNGWEIPAKKYITLYRKAMS
jgi:starch synthase